MTAPELKPCPFCGSAPQEYVASGGPVVNCETCDIEMLLSEWNTREDPPKNDLSACSPRIAEGLWHEYLRVATWRWDANAEHAARCAIRCCATRLGVYSQFCTLDEPTRHLDRRADTPLTPSEARRCPEVMALVNAAKGLLFAHDHGNGFEGWHNTRERLRAAIVAWDATNG